MSTAINPKRSGNVRGRKARRSILFSKAWVMMAPSLFFMGIIILVGLALIVIPDEANRRTQYEIETYRAISANNIIRARNCLENLIQISGENPKPEYLYQLAIISEQAGESERAFRLLERLTLPGKAGYAPAHVNLAEILLGQQNPSPATLDEAERHIQSLLVQRPEDPNYLRMQARLQLARNRPEDALKTYGLILDRDPSIGLPMGQILINLKREPEAKRLLNSAKTRLRVELDQNFENVDTRLKLADADLLLGEYQEAAKMLQSGITIGDPSNRLRKAMCVVLARWADSLGNKIEDLNQRLNLLVQGLSFDPTHPLLLNEFWKLAIEDLGNDPNQVLKLRVLGANLSILDAMSGLQELRLGKKADAKKSLESAVKKAPDLYVLLNNLTTIGEMRGNSKSNLGIDLLSVLLEIDPSKASIRENRGLIYLKMEKYPESIADLEQCVTASANEQALHMALSMAYDKTGDQKKANLHRSESERLLKASGRKVASKQDDTTKEEASKEKVKS
jgi:predicted Zn-dependent protease